MSNDVQMRWVGTDATGAAATSVKKNLDSVGKAASGASKEMERMAPAGKTASGALSSMDKAAGSVLKGLTGLGAAIGAGALVGLASQAVGAAAEMARLSESSAKLETSFNGLASSAGQSGNAMLASLKRASGGAISEYNLMLAANKAMMLGVADNADEMGALMEIAATRGAAMGLSMTQAFDNLVTGLGRGSALILDNLGIVVDAEATNEAYAESIGKTVEQLTDQEKKQALVNRTLQEATGAALPAASAYDRMSAGMADLKVAFGELISPAIVGGVNALADAVQNLNDKIADEKQIELGSSLADAALQFDTVLATYNERLEQWKANAAALEAFNGVKIEFPTFEGIPASNDQLGIAYQSLKGIADQYNEIASARGGALIDIDQLRQGVVAYQELETAIKSTGTAAEQSAAAQQSGADEIQRRADALSAIQDAYRGFVDMQDEVAAAAERAGLSVQQTDALLAQAAEQYGILTENGYTSAEAIDIVTGAMDRQIERLPALGDMISDLAAKLATEIPAAAAIASQAVASLFASTLAGIADLGNYVMRGGSNVNPSPSVGDRRRRDSGTTLANSPTIGSSTLDQFEMSQYRATRSADAAAAALAKAAKSGGSAAGSLGSLADKAGELSGKLQGLLGKVPGLTGTSEVTEEQQRLAEMGVPQNFADDYLRRLTDEITNGVDWEGVDIGDAAARAGIDPNLPSQVILELFRQSWDSSALFADAQNLDLINMDAVKASIQQQVAADAGKANIMALFGIGDDATVSAVAGLGLDIQSGLGQWLSDNGMPEAGAKLADALGVGVTEAGVAVDGGLKSWLSSDEGGQALDSYTKDLSERLSNGTVIKPRYEPPDLPEEESNTGTGTQGNSRTPAYASGTTWFGGGWAKVHRDEVVNLAAGPVYNARQARKFAPAGVVVNAVINNRIDQAQFERMLRTAVRKAQVG